MISEDAQKRLSAIREFTEFGSGFRIAMRDLEIRGAGNIFGPEQSGNVSTVGYDMYVKLINEAVREAQSEMTGQAPPKPELETRVDVRLDAYLPERYVRDDLQRMEIYKRIAAIEDKDGAEEMIDELLDRFGEPPKAVQNLISVAMLKMMAHKVYISEVKLTGNEVKISMYEKAGIQVAAIPDLLNMEKYRNRLEFRAAGKPHFLYRLKSPGERKSAEILSRMTELCTDMVNLL
jgi:transcription-repair coupling factor (superfamily II helicase)